MVPSSDPKVSVPATRFWVFLTSRWFPRLDNKSGRHNAGARDGIPATRIGLFPRSKSDVERSFDKRFNLQTSSNSLFDERAQCAALNYDRYAVPRRVLLRPLREVRRRHNIVRSAPLKTTVDRMFTAYDKETPGTQIFADEDHGGRQVGRPAQPIDRKHQV